MARRWEAGGGAGWWVRDSFVVRFCDCVASRIHRPAAFCVLVQSACFQFMHRLNANVVFLAFAWSE